MDAAEFRVRGKEIVDYIADYLENIHKTRVTPDVEPGYLRELLPKEAPQRGEKWEDIFRDFETKILPGVTHWQHPALPRLLSGGQLLPVYNRRDVVGGSRNRGLLMGR